MDDLDKENLYNKIYDELNENNEIILKSDDQECEYIFEKFNVHEIKIYKNEQDEICVDAKTDEFPNGEESDYDAEYRGQIADIMEEIGFEYMPNGKNYENGIFY